MNSIKVLFMEGACYDVDELKEDLLAAVGFFVDMERIKIYTVPDVNIPVNPIRKQVNAEELFNYTDRMSNIEQEGNEAIIYIIDKDLYLRQMNFIFGVANVRSRRIILSLYRLKRDYYGVNMIDSPKFRERVFKEVMHELGHIYGLNHCNNRDCVMSFSRSIMEVDKKLPMFCKSCLERLRGLINL